MRTTALIPRLAGTTLLTLVALAAGSCGDVTGSSPVIVVVERMEASAGGASEFSGFLLSDVQTGGGVINDSGRATFRLTVRNPGTPTAPIGASALNEVYLSRYRVRFIRADGRNTPGVDIPYGFDGAIGVTIPANGTAQAVFDLVRHQMKREPPLRQLWDGGGARFISTLAEVTFYGRDLAGNDVQAVGNIQVNFGDFVDPQ